MCEFLSWIEKDGNVYYLTYRDIYNTKRGKELRDYCKNKDDYIGHGAIRHYYDNFVGGKKRECTDFSTPNRFPTEIVSAVKKGEFRGLRTPVELLSAEGRKVYDAATAEAQKVYYAATAEPQKVYDAVMAEPQKVYDAATAEAQKVYYAAIDKEFWDLFKVKKNRNPLWR